MQFYVNTTYGPMYEAEENCQYNGGHLATYTSMTEQVRVHAHRVPLLPRQSRTDTAASLGMVHEEARVLCAPWVRTSCGRAC